MESYEENLSVLAIPNVPAWMPEQRSMMRRPLHIAQWAELVYAIVALFLGFSLPWPPTGAIVGTWLHWIATGILAAAIAIRLGKPNSAVWYVAALLSGYVLASSLVALFRIGGVTADVRDAQFGASIVTAALIWMTQLVVATCLYFERALRHGRTKRW